MDVLIDNRTNVTVTAANAFERADDFVVGRLARWDERVHAFYTCSVMRYGPFLAMNMSRERVVATVKTRVGMRVRM